MIQLRLATVLLGDVARDLVRHRGQHLLAILTLSCGLMLAGGGLLAVEILDRWVGRMETQARITVFAVEGGRLEETEGKLRLDPRFLEVRRVSSEEATRRFTAASREAGLMLQSLGGEKIPENLEIALRPEFTQARRAVEVGDSLRGLPGVGDVIVDQERLQAFQNAARMARSALGFLGLLLLLAAGFSTGNVIRMTILSREEEIAIMRLVGATEGFIRAPLMVEGAVLGLLASLLASGALLLIWLPLNRGLGGLPPLLVELARMGFFSWKSLALLAGLGAVTGGLGSLWGFQATQRDHRDQASRMEEAQQG
jgi:cell division transport system permease protein